jgi:hypothetical protein
MHFTELVAWSEVCLRVLRMQPNRRHGSHGSDVPQSILQPKYRLKERKTKGMRPQTEKKHSSSRRLTNNQHGRIIQVI